MQLVDVLLLLTFVMLVLFVRDWDKVLSDGKNKLMGGGVMVKLHTDSLPASFHSSLAAL